MTTILIEYFGPVAMGIAVFLVQMVIKSNTRLAILESQVKKLNEEVEDLHDNYKDNFAKVFASLEEIKIRIERMDAHISKD